MQESQSFNRIETLPEVCPGSQFFQSPEFQEGTLANQFSEPSNDFSPYETDTITLANDLFGYITDQPVEIIDNSESLAENWFKSSVQDIEFVQLPEVEEPVIEEHSSEISFENFIFDFQIPEIYQYSAVNTNQEEAFVPDYSSQNEITNLETQIVENNQKHEDPNHTAPNSRLENKDTVSKPQTSDLKPLSSHIKPETTPEIHAEKSQASKSISSQSIKVSNSKNFNPINNFGNPPLDFPEDEVLFEEELYKEEEIDEEPEFEAQQNFDQLLMIPDYIEDEKRETFLEVQNRIMDEIRIRGRENVSEIIKIYAEVVEELEIYTDYLPESFAWVWIIDGQVYPIIRGSDSFVAFETNITPDEEDRNQVISIENKDPSSKEEILSKFNLDPKFEIKSVKKDGLVTTPFHIQGISDEIEQTFERANLENLFSKQQEYVSQELLIDDTQQGSIGMITVPVKIETYDYTTDTLTQDSTQYDTEIITDEVILAA